MLADGDESPDPRLKAHRLNLLDYIDGLARFTGNKALIAAKPGGICDGDSGGPNVFHDDKGKLFLFAVNSWLDLGLCGVNKEAGGAVAVNVIYDWLQQSTAILNARHPLPGRSDRPSNCVSSSTTIHRTGEQGELETNATSACEATVKCALYGWYDRADQTRAVKKTPYMDRFLLAPASGHSTKLSGVGGSGQQVSDLLCYTILQ